MRKKLIEAELALENITAIFSSSSWHTIYCNTWSLTRQIEYLPEFYNFFLSQVCQRIRLAALVLIKGFIWEIKKRPSSFIFLNSWLSWTTDVADIMSDLSVMTRHELCLVSSKPNSFIMPEKKNAGEKVWIQAKHDSNPVRKRRQYVQDTIDNHFKKNPI